MLDTAAVVYAEVFDSVASVTDYTKAHATVRMLSVCGEGEEGAKRFLVGASGTGEEIYICLKAVNYRTFKAITNPTHRLFFQSTDSKEKYYSSVPFAKIVQKDGAFYGAITKYSVRGYTISEDNYCPDSGDEFVLRIKDGKVVSSYSAYNSKPLSYVSLVQR